MSDIDAKIRELEVELEKARNEKLFKEGLSPAKQLAIELHKRFCHHNHADYCDWEYGTNEYGIPNWKEFSHKNYLAKAEECLKHVDYDTMICIADALKS